MYGSMVAVSDRARSTLSWLQAGLTGAQRWYLRLHARTPGPLPPGIQICWAESADDLRAAFALMGRVLPVNRLAAGLVRRDQLSPAASIYHLLPTTRVLIAKRDGQVVACLTFIKDSMLGLPVEASCDVSRFRNNRARLAELAWPVVAEGLGARHWSVLAHLFRHAYLHALRDAGVDMFVGSVARSQLAYVEGVMFCRQLFPGLAVAPHAHVFIDLRLAFERFASHYRGLGVERNLFRFFTEDRSATRAAGEWRLAAADFRELFSESIPLLGDLAAPRRQMIQELYPSKEHKQVIAGEANVVFLNRARRQPRFASECRGFIDIKGRRQKIDLAVSDVSIHGFRATLSSPIRFGGFIDVTMQLPGDVRVALKALPVWNDQAMHYGFKIELAARSWAEYVQACQASKNKQAR